MVSTIYLDCRGLLKPQRCGRFKIHPTYICLFGPYWTSDHYFTFKYHLAKVKAIPVTKYCIVAV